jgi:hypothetical protein
VKKLKILLHRSSALAAILNFIVVLLLFLALRRFVIRLTVAAASAQKDRDYYNKSDNLFHDLLFTAA